MASEPPSPSKRPQDPNARGWQMVAEYSGLAIAFPIAALLGYAGGTWLDQKLGTGFLAIVGLLLGVAAGFLQLVRKALSDAKRRS